MTDLSSQPQTVQPSAPDPENLPKTLGELETTLDELFDRDPNEHTIEDRSLILAALRNAKDTWYQEERDAKAAGRKPSHTKKGTKNPKTLAAQAKLIASETDMELDDLDLDGGLDL